MTDQGQRNDGSLVPFFILLPQPPAPPTWEQMALAIDAWAVAGDTRELRNGDPVCMALLRIADRLVKSREMPQSAHSVDSGRSTPSGVLQESPPRQEGAGDDNGWANIVAANAKLLTQAIEKLAAAERELEAALHVVRAADRLVKADSSWLAARMGKAEAREADAAAANLRAELATFHRQRDTAGRGEP